MFYSSNLSLTNVPDEIDRLTNALNLKKGTEVFMSDLHGEHLAFQHLMRSGAGVVRQKVRELFGSDMDQKDQDTLTHVIYYPEEKLKFLGDQNVASDFYIRTLRSIMVIARDMTTMYTKEELLEMLDSSQDDLFMSILNAQDSFFFEDFFKQKSLIGVWRDRIQEVIIEAATAVQKLSIKRLHVIGDVYDRGPAAEVIMDEIVSLKNVDFQWGNHDIIWMGAACGSEACMANVLRVSLKYGNVDTLNSYGIDLNHLALFAVRHYDDSGFFDPKIDDQIVFSSTNKYLWGLMYKAISVIQFKLEGHLIRRRPEFDMDDRLLLDKITLEDEKIDLNGEVFKLNDAFFPTLNSKTPYELAAEELELVDALMLSFKKSKKLQTHADFLFHKGSMYHISDNDLLFHGCIPMEPNGQFKLVDLGYGPKKGKELMDFYQLQVRKARSSNGATDSYAADIIWYLWAGPFSPLFGKSKMATFERHFIDDKKTHAEGKDPYFHFRDDPKTCDMILKEFGLDKMDATILNGHMPVSVKNGENPVKANGHLVVIDGGFSKAYRSKTGIAGYTLVHDCHGRQLMSYNPFHSIEKTIREELYMVEKVVVLSENDEPTLVQNTQEGIAIMSRIQELEDMIVPES